MRSSGEYIVAKSGADTNDIIAALCAAVPAAINQVSPYITNILQATGDPVKDAERACRYVRGLVTYEQDGFEEQKIQLPARLLKVSKKGDCKSYSLAVLAILTAMGYKAGFRFASYKPNKIFTHVYNFVLDSENNLHTFDACVESLKESPRFTRIKDMNVTYLAGSPLMIESQSDSFLGRRRGRGNKPGKGKVLTLAPARQAYLALVRINFRGLATRQAQLLQKNPKDLDAFWTKLGGDVKKLRDAIAAGKNKRPVFGKGKGISAYDDFYLGAEGDGSGESKDTIATITKFLPFVAPLLTAISQLFKKNKIDDSGTVLPEEESPLDPNGEGFTPGDPDPGAKTTPGTLTTGFSPSPLMIGGIALGALALIYLTKKK